MGHVLSFTHCKDAPSTASSTPDSCPPDGELDDEPLVTQVDFWPLPSPQEPTFSYITIGSPGPWPRPAARPRRGRGQGHKEFQGQGREEAPRTETPNEEMVSFVLLEKVCQLSQIAPAPPLRIQEKTEFMEKPHLQEIDCRAVKDLLYWRDIPLSAACLTGITLSLLCLIQFSVISVVSYGCLIVLSATLTLRIYTKFLHKLKKGSGSNPFQYFLDVDLMLPSPQLEAVAARVINLCCCALCTLRNLFLVKDIKESLKFLLLLYLLTYVGAVFNGLTLLVLVVIGAFTFPLLYKQNKAQVDSHIALLKKRVNSFRTQLQAQPRKAGAKKD
ncbi:reticulon-2 [Spea bombifrons]|uniref:reticulon-2 n=1 Tax=Spea bombifrons TaxID=233779 RepID=UPI00234991B1|nr:reticulon-2 [Spea bombifrons]